MYRNTYVKINEATLKNNVKTILRKYNQYKYYFGVVKGNCYGHGTTYVINELIESGVNYFAVSSLEEAFSDMLPKLKSEDVVLLSPGGTSFGLFQNEFHRGRVFNECVNKL